MIFMKKEIQIWFYQLLIIGVLFIFTNSCKKDDNDINNNNQTEQIPIITIVDIKIIMQTSSIYRGIITSEGNSPVIAKGLCWSTSETPTIADSKTLNGTGTSGFTSTLTGLTPNTTYYVRAYATNNVGTGYSSQVSFTTLKTSYGTVSDYDGNIYNTVVIGTQVWMVENFKTTRFNDGTAIPLITNDTEWSNLTTSGYCWYNNDSITYKNTYGALYNWYTVDTGKLCPTGWHVPTDVEWQTLVNYLGGDNAAGGKMKEIDTTHWQSPNTGATNESNFTALPGGTRLPYSTFDYIKNKGNWWSSTEGCCIGSAWALCLNFNNSYVVHSKDDQKAGFSVRCIRD
jgi:uncharacterized protein (TIGR02145 family)